MAKRFTDTDKWRDPWYCSLSTEEKLFWNYLLDTCTVSGIWQVNWPLVKFYVPGFVYREEAFADRVEKLSDEKWFIRKFVQFQYGDLKENNRLHQRILFELQKEGVSKGYRYPSQGVKDKEQEQDKVSLDGGVGEGPTPKDLIDLWNQTAHAALPRVAYLTETRKTHAKCRLTEHPERGFWEDLVARVNRSPHLRGENNRNWKASFDWVIKPDNLAKIVEGNYDPR